MVPVVVLGAQRFQAEIRPCMHMRYFEARRYEGVFHPTNLAPARAAQSRHLSPGSWTTEMPCPRVITSDERLEQEPFRWAHPRRDPPRRMEFGGPDALTRFRAADVFQAASTSVESITSSPVVERGNPALPLPPSTQDEVGSPRPLRNRKRARPPGIGRPRDLPPESPTPRRSSTSRPSSASRSRITGRG